MPNDFTCFGVTQATVANAYGKRYGQWKGTKQAYTTQDSQASVTVTFNR